VAATRRGSYGDALATWTATGRPWPSQIAMILLPLVPICTHCHVVGTERQRLHWFYRQMVMNKSEAMNEIESGVSDAATK
jgi:hypothetical protein